MNGTTYFFVIRSVDQNGNKSAGHSRTVVPVAEVEEDTIPPASVTALVLTPGDGSVELSWAEPADEDFAAVEITYTPDGPTTPIKADRGTTTKTITGLTNGKTYAFTVRSVDEQGNKSTGNSRTVMPEPEVFLGVAEDKGEIIYVDGIESILMISGSEDEFTEEITNTVAILVPMESKYSDMYLLGLTVDKIISASKEVTYRITGYISSDEWYFFNSTDQIDIKIDGVIHTYSGATGSSMSDWPVLDTYLLVRSIGISNFLLLRGISQDTPIRVHTHEGYIDLTIPALFFDWLSDI